MPLVAAEGIAGVDVALWALVEIATGLIVFFLGAAAGSFLNVVVGRLPRGQSVVWPPSRCPACQSRITLRDNIPILSWLRLRGRCRECGGSISPGYLLVELLMGLLVLDLFYVELCSGGVNLPLRPVAHYTGALFTLWSPSGDLLPAFLGHVLLMWLLLGMVLICWQGDDVSPALVAFGVGAAIVGSYVWPGLQQVPVWYTGFERPGVPSSAEAVLAAVFGAAYGAALGWVLSAAAPGPSVVPGCVVTPRRSGLPEVLGVAGAFLGWQAAVSVACFTALGMLGRLPPILCGAAGVLLQLLCWRWLTAWAPWWPGPETSTPLMSGWQLALALLVTQGASVLNWVQKALSRTTIRS